MKTSPGRLSAYCFALASVVFATTAAAHISLEQGGTHLSRYGDADLKDGPCGLAGGTRGTHIYTYAPGQTITVKLKETITHPSYFRFAFDNDGDDDFKEPASIKPIDPTRACPIDSGDKCGASDFYNSPTVLANEDDLNPHLAQNALPLYTWQVTLPNVECDNCTLQVIQVMEDNFLHGDYNPSPNDPADTGFLGHVPDIYHQCIDIVLKAGGGDVGSGGTTGVGSSGAPSSDGGATGVNPAAGGNPSTGNPGNPGAGGASSSGTGGVGVGPGASSGGTAESFGGAFGAGDEPGDTSSSKSGGCNLSRYASNRSASSLALVGLAALAVRRRRQRAPR